MNRKEPVVRLENIDFHYPTNPERNVLKSVSFELWPGEIVCLAGPNGCGKSTLINLMAGFMEPSGGKILIRGGRGSVRVVFQQLGLLEWKNVEDNIGLALLYNKLSKDEYARSVLKYLGICKLETERFKIPKELSGGMKQRTAIARALAPNPALLLLDEPFSSLDRDTRAGLQKDLCSIAKKINTTILMATHYPEEWLQYADRFLIIRNGRVNEKACQNP